MAVRPIDAAKMICERGSWKVTNLALQKILYIAHMVHMGRTESRLVDSHFEAWDYGPVVPSLYHKVKAFGDKPIPDIFLHASKITGVEAETLDEACEFLLPKRSGQLVAMTHWKDGAWAKNYIPGALGTMIPDADIVNEYKKRFDRK